MKLQKGQKLTIFSISDWMAHTQKQEVEVTSFHAPIERRSYQTGPVTAHRFGSMIPRGKRKEYYLDISLDSLVFDSWDLPLKTDSEILKGSFSGNACFNLGGMTPEAARLFIETALNAPISDGVKAKIIHVADGASVSDDGELLWPEIEIAHAVVNRMKERTCPTCGRPSASPSSNLCGTALMGRDCRNEEAKKAVQS